MVENTPNQTQNITLIMILSVNGHPLASQVNSYDYLIVTLASYSFLRSGKMQI